MYKRTNVFDPTYYKFLGSWAWILHRLSGLALIFYLILHIWIIHTLTQGEAKFNRLMLFLGSELFKFLEIGLWAVILFHAFNGVRIVITDFFQVSANHKGVFYALIAFAFILWLLGGFIIISHLHG